MAIIGFRIVDEGRRLLLVERTAAPHPHRVIVLDMEELHDILEIAVAKVLLRLVEFRFVDKYPLRLLSLTSVIISSPELLLRLLDFLSVQLPELAVDAVALGADRGVRVVRQQAVELALEMVCSVHIVSPILPAAPCHSPGSFRGSRTAHGT